MVVKFIFGSYTKKMGEKVQSQSLIASGTDAFMDSILSLSTFVAAIITMTVHISLEGILGVVLSGFILKAGFEILLETLSSIIGDRTDAEFSVALKKEISSYEGVNGTYDLVLHDYGPSRSIGSVHIEVDDVMTADDIYRLTRKIMEDVYLKHGIVMTIGIYATNTTNQKVIGIRTDLADIIKKEEYVLQMHGFYVDKAEKKMRFDMVISFDADDRKKVYMEVCENVKKEFPDYELQVAMDTDFSEGG